MTDIRPTFRLSLLLTIALIPKATTAAEPADFVAPTKQAWTGSRFVGTPEPPPPYRLETLYKSTQLEQPVVLTTAPGLNLWFAVELKGRVLTFPIDGDGKESVEFLNIKDLRPDATRAYGLTFHPDFESNHLAYICYITKAKEPDATFVSEIEVEFEDGRPRYKAGTERVLIRWLSGGHNGGCLKFGPDGMLYITTGDADSPSPPDELETGQDISDLLSSVLRIDVSRKDAGLEYAIPADNPFTDIEEARPEVWAYGFRNPWKITFDRKTGDLWCGDVGWELWELVYQVESGGNYGWSVVEGPQSVKPESPRGPTPILPPVTAHSHTESRSVTGGFVYRGSRLPELEGCYLYGDYVTGKLWGLRYDGSKMTWQSLLAETGLAIITFGEDHDGEIYVVTYDGSIHRLVENEESGESNDFPRQLSQTGLFEEVSSLKTAPGVFEYTINSPHWNDGTASRRFAAIPPAASKTPILPKLEVHKRQSFQEGVLKGHWDIPSGSVFVRNVGWPQDDGSPYWLETQVLRRQDDRWQAYSYVWNKEQTDAELAPAAGLTIAHPDQSELARHDRQWKVHSRTQCMVCHSNWAGNILGFRYGQLDRRPASGTQIEKNQLAALESVGLIDLEEKRRPTSQRMPDPFDESQPLADRARSWLHTNCAHCHRKGGGGTAPFELQYHLKTEDLNLLGQRPSQGSFAIYQPAVVAPGRPYQSLLLYRLGKHGRGHMPHLGASMVDERAIVLIRDWIKSMDPNADTDSAPLLAEEADEQEIQQALTSTSRALRLACELHDDRYRQPTADRIVKLGMAVEDDHVRGLFEPFVPAASRPRRFGTNTSLQQLLAVPGDADRGRKLFAETEGIQCRSCHKVGNTGRELGPKLDGIGKKLNRQQLVESILEPSKKVEQKYLLHLVETTEGRVYSGLIASRNDQQIQLLQTDGKSVTIPRKNVEVMVPQDKSMMPELLLRDMTQQQVADLIAYLSSLK